MDINQWIYTQQKGIETLTYLQTPKNSLPMLIHFVSECYYCFKYKENARSKNETCNISDI